MKKYTVTLVEKVYYTVEVEAQNSIQAGDLASDMWANSDDPTKDFDGQGEGVFVVHVSGEPPNPPPMRHEPRREEKTMKITVYVLNTCITDENRPCHPEVFTSYDAAEAVAEERLRAEWEHNAPCDDEGDPLPYPGNWREANAAISDKTPEWGQWELTSHEIDLGALAIVMEGGAIQSMLSTGPLAGNSVTVIEYSDKSDEYDVLIPQDGGDPAPAAVGKIEIEESANWLLRALMAINEMEAA